MQLEDEEPAYLKTNNGYFRILGEEQPVHAQSKAATARHRS